MPLARSLLPIAVILSAGALLFPGVAAAMSDPVSCEVGVYAGSGDEFLAITERPSTGETGEWRYTFPDGRFGSTKSGPVACGTDAVFVTDGGATSPWKRAPLRLTPTRFRSGDAMLEGLLIEPPGANPNRPLVVMVHGSERTQSIRRSSYPYILAGQGISAFVYDKRGTGGSGGQYHQNFHKLAIDVVAASVEARRLARGRFGKFGLFGGSQGGWVAPRAATDAGADFVAVGFGLLIDPLEEDAEQVQQELAAAGFGAEALARAREVTDATGAMMAAHFRSGYERLASVKRRFSQDPWFKSIKGEFSGEILSRDEAALRRDGPAELDNLDIDWRYDAVGELRKVKAPQLWVIAGEDREAPPLNTIARLGKLRKSGKKIEIALFPDTDHGMVEYGQGTDGSRNPTRITDGYFRLLADWIKGRSSPPYGRARFVARD